MLPRTVIEQALAKLVLKFQSFCRFSVKKATNRLADLHRQGLMPAGFKSKNYRTKPRNLEI